MKRIDNHFKLLVAIIVVLGISLSVMAQPSRKGPMPHRSMKAKSGLQYLDLTEEQKDQIKTIHLANMKDVQPLKDEIKINRVKVDALLKKDDPDMKEIVSLVEANGKLITQIRVKSIEQKISVRSLLTDEQKIIYDARGERYREHRAMAEHNRHRRTAERTRF
jgi:Spy/CpxP family protein refolding chaperone